MEYQRPVVVELKVRLLVDASGLEKPEDIEFWLNECSHCLGNEIEKLHEDEEKAGKDGCCFICHRAEAKYLREATEADLFDLDVDRQHGELQS